MKHKTIHLGFEVGTGKPIAIPLKHTAVTGQTQESGKTTTLEALVSRMDVPSLAFITKRGESSFAGGHRIPPYFRDRADWQFVDQLLEAQLHEKNKFLRPWIMRICRNTKTLADVQREVRQALEKAKGLNEGVYTQLDAYLELIVPELGRASLASMLRLADGLSVMDLSSYSTPMQMLFVQSAIDWINAHEKGVVTIVPEAWEFIPEGKGSPVKSSAVSLVRKGAGIGNLIWVDSQDMAGVDKVILRGCAVWLIGVQREANEIKRNLSNIPAGIKRPKPGDVARLSRGQFYACWGEHIFKVYVQPAWMGDELAIATAKGELSIDDAQLAAQPTGRQTEAIHNEPDSLPEEDEMAKEDIDRLSREIQSLGSRLEQVLVGHIRRPDEPVVKGGDSGGVVVDEVLLYRRFRDRLQKESPAILKVLATKNELEVTVEKKVITADETSALGMIAILLSEGFLKSAIKAGDVWKEMKRRWNYGGISARAYEQLDKLTAMGFVSKEADGFKEVPGMKVNIKKQKSQEE